MALGLLFPEADVNTMSLVNSGDLRAHLSRQTALCIKDISDLHIYGGLK